MLNINLTYTTPPQRELASSILPVLGLYMNIIFVIEGGIHQTGFSCNYDYKSFFSNQMTEIKMAYKISRLGGTLSFDNKIEKGSYKVPVSV